MSVEWPTITLGDGEAPKKEIDFNIVDVSLGKFGQTLVTANGYCMPPVYLQIHQVCH